jgi:phenylalanyl-tRNA synthetase beta chain
VFAQNGAEPHESSALTLLHAGPSSGAGTSGAGPFARLSSDVLTLLRRITGADARVERGTLASLHPGKTAALRCGESVVGYVGVVDPRLARAYGVADTTALATLFVEALPPRTTPAYVPPSRFPAVDRDLAVIVPEDVLAGDLLDTVRPQPLVRSATVFDEYRGPQVGAGKKSLALRVVLQSDEATLTDEDADAAVERIVGALRERFGATLRGGEAG